MHDGRDYFKASRTLTPVVCLPFPSTSATRLGAIWMGKRWGDALTRLRGFPLKTLKSPTLGLKSKGDVARSLGVSDSKVRSTLPGCPPYCGGMAIAVPATLGAVAIEERFVECFPFYILDFQINARKMEHLEIQGVQLFGALLKFLIFHSFLHLSEVQQKRKWKKRTNSTKPASISTGLTPPDAALPRGRAVLLCKTRVLQVRLC